MSDAIACCQRVLIVTRVMPVWDVAADPAPRELDTSLLHEPGCMAGPRLKGLGDE
jgi:hypothetical protein